MRFLTPPMNTSQPSDPLVTTRILTVFASSFSSVSSFSTSSSLTIATKIFYRVAVEGTRSPGIAAV